jgi:hypothetical protein
MSMTRIDLSCMGESEPTKFAFNGHSHYNGPKEVIRFSTSRSKQLERINSLGGTIVAKCIQ